VVDLAVTTRGLKVLSKEHETRLTLSARNLLDARYSEPGFGGFDLPNQGRTVMVELRQQL
jgi:hypothetical protein